MTMQMHAAANSSMSPIKVELSWTPEEVTAGTAASFKAVVTQDGEPVDDAREVMFEVNEAADKTKKVEIKGESAGEGAYVGNIPLMRRANSASLHMWLPGRSIPCQARNLL